MSNKDDIDYDIGSYKCEGSLEHFKFRVCVEISRTSFHQKNTEIEKKYTKRIEKIVNWTEKTVEEPHDQNDLEETSSSIEGKLLDSYLRTEFSHQNNNRTILHDVMCQDNVLTEAFKKMSLLKNHTKNVHFIAKNILDGSPSESLKLQNRLPVCNQIMQVLLDLGNNGAENEENNLVLVSLYWNPNNRILTIFPDFTSNNCAGYILPISTVKDSCFEYRFWIENLSNESLEQLSINTVNFHLLKLDHYNFYIPECDTIEVFAEITSASGFEYDNLFVRYYVDLPFGWKCANPESQCGTTQTCRRNNNMTSVFSYLFNCTIVLPQTDDDPKSQHMNSACITFVIYSIDFWDKERVEGYTCYQIPKFNTPTKRNRNIVLEAWLPKSRKCVDNLQRYFIGGSVKLAEPNYTFVPNSFDSKLLSKFGMETGQSGSINIKVDCLKQCCKSVENTKNANANNIVSAQALVKSVNSVMASFKRARQRMLLACQPILSPSHD